MKKIIILLLVFSVCLCFLCSCGEKAVSCNDPDCTCGETAGEWKPNADEPWNFTPGWYRLVLPLYDGTTRYLNFVIHEEDYEEEYNKLMEQFGQQK